ncbi:MAG: 16S rRNA (cytosine(1402)-N(4))-methyltransferase RsmH [Bacteroidetes bacterium]|nr:16S rRNA (cytosine(1402)-N(4))-methyltransferase RsmH [Bacteroidota bacterium]
MNYHNPVLLKESIEGLNIKPNGIYVDVTYGGGGHSCEILKKLDKGKLLAFDVDEDVLKNVSDNENFTLINANFRFIKNFLKFHNSIPVDGIIADLGISSHQIDNPERGFSIRSEGELDLRMDQKSEMTARDVLSNYSSDELKEVFHKYGEFSNAGKLANAIVYYRNEHEIITLQDIKNAVGRFALRGKENKFYARIFQALRIEINNELDSLKELLMQSTEVLKKGGRLVVISYHSLEDRLVKNYMKSGNFEGIIEKDFFGNEITPMEMLTRKPIVPLDEEIEKNNRARSAKLRIAIKK